MPILVSVLLAATAGHPSAAGARPQPGAWSTYDDAACAVEAAEIALVLEDEIATDADSPRDCAAPPMPAFLDCHNPAAGFWVDRMIGDSVAAWRGGSCAAPKQAPSVPLPHFAHAGGPAGHAIGAVAASGDGNPALLPTQLLMPRIAAAVVTVDEAGALSLSRAFRLERPPRS